MSGNDYEWCYDLFYSDVTINDSSNVNSDGFIVNPTGSETGSYHLLLEKDLVAFSIFPFDKRF